MNALEPPRRLDILEHAAAVGPMGCLCRVRMREYLGQAGLQPLDDDVCSRRGRQAHLPGHFHERLGYGRSHPASGGTQTRRIRSDIGVDGPGKDSANQDRSITAFFSNAFRHRGNSRFAGRIEPRMDPFVRVKRSERCRAKKRAGPGRGDH